MPTTADLTYLISSGLFMGDFSEQKSANDNSSLADRERLEKGKIADKPHSITIVLALVPALLAVIATIISLQSLYTTTRSMKVGQRAYVSLQNGSLELSSFKNSPQLIIISATFTIENLGNTPADIKPIEVNIKHASNWTERNLNPPDREFSHRSTTPGTLGQHSSVKWAIVKLYNCREAHPPSAREDDCDVDWLDKPIVVKGTITYADVFGESHETKWCWENSRYGKIPVDCSNHNTSNH